MLLMGASGHSLEVLQVLLQNGNERENIAFFDNTSNAPRRIFNFYPVINSIDLLTEHFKNDPNFAIAVGNPFSRKLLFDLAFKAGGKPVNVISETAILGQHSRQIGWGLNIMHNVFISENTIIEDGVLLNASCNVHHDVSIGSFTEVSPGSKLLGNASIGRFSQIGAGAIVLPNIKVGSNSIIGAGAVVTKDIPDNSVAVGVPARVIKTLKSL